MNNRIVNSAFLVHMNWWDSFEIDTESIILFVLLLFFKFPLLIAVISIIIFASVLSIYSITCYSTVFIIHVTDSFRFFFFFLNDTCFLSRSYAILLIADLKQNKKKTFHKRKTPLSNCPQHICGNTAKNIQFEK